MFINVSMMPKFSLLCSSNVPQKLRNLCRVQNLHLHATSVLRASVAGTQSCALQAGFLAFALFYAALREFARN